MYQIKRIVDQAIITPAMDPVLLNNINGASVIKVPSWCENALGKYYMYFAHHGGKFIRLAYADNIEGPWTVHTPGTLQLEQTPFIGHIASPDVHIDEENKRIIMYYHGVVPKTVRDHRGQRSCVAFSNNGLDFNADNKTILGAFYFRIFEHEGYVYSIAKRTDSPGGGVLARSKDGFSAFEQGPNILENQRHVALLKRGNEMDIFYSRGEDNPESILLATMDLNGDWKSWTPSEPKLILKPELDYEGANLPKEASFFGAVHKPVNQLRDPCIYCEDDRIYMFYCCAGETSISMVELIKISD